MAFQFDLYLTERFAVSEFHLVLFLFRQPTKTSQICCCLHLKGLNLPLAPSSKPRSQPIISTPFQILQDTDRTKFLRWINVNNIFLNFLENSFMVVHLLDFVSYDIFRA